MTTVYSLNVESFKADKSIRFFEQMQREEPDIICLQETGREADSFPSYARLEGYHRYGEHGSTTPGFTGVAIYTRKPAKEVQTALCPEKHPGCSGRFIRCSVGGVDFVSIYAHADGPGRAPTRLRFLDCLRSFMARTAETPCIISLDANVALTRDDVATDSQFRGPWASKKYRGPVLSAMEGGKWVDAFRSVHGACRRATVWTSTNFASETEMGYAVDFQLVSRPLASSILNAEVLKPASWSARFSDHAVIKSEYRIA